ncbi:MAG: N-acetylglucosaminyl-diphospho-decaprenol L-rhamnosyltransferase, partial [Patescibacteria group bacterium]|nr:N-acetylglucosaminyl-diphospho-decaprenol L-rhamnosyltransferase [Patescibacteria group bacterium]
MAASLADITIVIPYYSGKQSLNTLLNYLVSLSVIVVNNSASKVDSRLSKKNVQVIDMPFNSGFAHACNVGALAATTPWILFLNPDVEISESAIETLLAEVQDRSLQA